MIQTYLADTIIPEIWKYKIEKTGILFVSNKTLAETDRMMLDIFLAHNCYFLEEVVGGAFIKK